MNESANIPITLDGKDFELVPTLQACMTISSMNGGLNAAAQRCMALDFNTIVAIIGAGLVDPRRGTPLNPSQAKMVPEAVYKTGLMLLAPPCIDFINVIGNGGRPVDYEPEGGDGKEPAEDPLPPA